MIETKPVCSWMGRKRDGTIPCCAAVVPLLLYFAVSLMAASFDRGMAAFKSGNYAAAAREFEKAASEQPNNAEYQKMLG